MKIAFARTMPHFSMDVYANGLISGLRTVCSDAEIIELKPQAINRDASSLRVRGKKVYERFWQFPQTVQKQAADIVHVVDHSDAHIVHWVRKVDRPVVVTCHDVINLLHPENLKGSVRFPLISDYLSRYSIQAMEKADAVIAVSEETAKNICKLFSITPEQITVIPNAVEPIFQPLPEQKSQAFRRQHNVSEDTFCLLNVGGNSPRKNLMGILKTLNSLKQRGLPIQLWKISDDFTDEDKNFIQTNNLQDSIQYFGCLDKPTLVAAYNAADVLMAPSFHEGFGITLLEAMASGTPVITSNVSAMPEVVGPAGIQVNPHDIEAIANAVVSLYNNPTYARELSEKGLQRVKLFTWENVATKMNTVYRKILKN